MTRITRVEVIDENGRSYVNWKEDNDITLSYQDDGRTLKVFVNTMKPKSPAEEAYKKVYGSYPMGEPFWIAFQKGYNASQEDYKVGEFQHLNEELLKSKEKEMIKKNLKTSLQELVNGDVRPIDDVVRETKNQQITELVRECVKWCEENPEKSVEDYLKPHTPEQTEKSLKEAFVKAQQTEEWKETQRKIDEEDNDKNFKNSIDLIGEWGEKNKPKTLYQICMEWWDEVFVNEMDVDNDFDVLVSRIDKEFIPRSHIMNGYEWEKCLKMIRDKLR